MEFLVRTSFEPSAVLEDSELEDLRARERTAAERLQQRGVLRSIWREPGSSRAVGIWHATNERALQAHISSLPTARHMHIEVTPLAVHPNAISASTSGSPNPYITLHVRKLAERHGVDMAEIRGTGEGGRVRRDDILALVRRAAASGVTHATLTVEISELIDPFSAVSAAVRQPDVTVHDGHAEGFDTISVDTEPSKASVIVGVARRTPVVVGDVHDLALSFATRVEIAFSFGSAWSGSRAALAEAVTASLTGAT